MSLLLKSLRYVNVISAARIIENIQSEIKGLISTIPETPGCYAGDFLSIERYEYAKYNLIDRNYYFNKYLWF